MQVTTLQFGAIVKINESRWDRWTLDGGRLSDATQRVGMIYGTGVVLA